MVPKPHGRIADRSEAVEVQLRPTSHRERPTALSASQINIERLFGSLPKGWKF